MRRALIATYANHDYSQRRGGSVGCAPRDSPAHRPLATRNREPDALPPGGGSTRTLAQPVHDWGLPLLLWRHAMPLAALDAQMAQEYTTRVSVSTMGGRLTAPRLTTPKKTLATAEPHTPRVQPARLTSGAQSAAVDLQRCEFVDASHVHLALTRLDGRAPLGSAQWAAGRDPL